MYCILDRNAPIKIYESLRELNYKIIESMEMGVLDTSISSHPDMQVFKVSDSHIIVEPSTYEYYSRALEGSGVKVSCGKSEIGSSYPNSIKYNGAVIGETLIHKTDYTDLVILNEFENRIHVKQGYSKCSVVELPNGLITSDAGIYKSCCEKLDCLLIQVGSVTLSGYNYGFLGGASGYGDRLYFAGNLELHPSFEEIKKFLLERGIDYISLTEEPLVDIGSIIFLK